MITLVNGRGQLGEHLRRKINNVKTKDMVYIYHTWNVWDKSLNSQKKEYEKFCDFVKEYKLKGKIIFVSTYSSSDNHYVFYKQKAEAFLLLNCENSLTIRLPNLIGSKGIFNKLKTKTVDPYGQLEIMKLEEAASKIIEFSFYKGLCRSFTFRGQQISATTLNEIIHAFDGEENEK